MDEISILIGGRAGDGIDRASVVIARMLSHLGWRIYIYRDYPSIIRGGHTFSIIRVAKKTITCHTNRVDFVLALNQDCIDLHKDKLKNTTVILYNSDAVRIDTVHPKKAIGLPLEKIVKEENAKPVMRNSCIIGGFAKAIGTSFDILEKVFRREITKEIEVNLKVASRAFESVQECATLESTGQKNLSILTGAEAIGFGLIKGGLKAYIAYPMTPSSGILHFLASIADDFSLNVIHPESEISVILMALGFSYVGQKVAVGTSGGGFCLMTEALSLSAMSELPVVIVLGQRPGPSTGLPTYTSQTELQFALSAGQGEFPRFIVAPSDAESAYYWSGICLNMAWKYQIPAFILTDKTLNEGTFNFDVEAVKELKEEVLPIWDRNPPYRRYLDTVGGVSPLAFVPDKEAIIKVNSYEHDESGITTEDPVITEKMQDKRLRKRKFILEELDKFEAVRISGKKDSSCAILCWGSNEGVCREVAQKLNLKTIQVSVLEPFPLKQFKEATGGVKKLICVENNATGQLQRLLNMYGLGVNEAILKYDGRPFALDELEEKIRNRL